MSCAGISVKKKLFIKKQGIDTDISCAFSNGILRINNGFKTTPNTGANVVLTISDFKNPFTTK